MRLRIFISAMCFALPLWVGAAAPQEEGGVQSADEVAAELRNPTTPLAKLTTTLEYRSFRGGLPEAGDQSSWNIAFQPGFPFKVGDIPLLGKDRVLFVRPLINIPLNQPFATADGFDSHDVKFGDIPYDLAVGGVSPSGILTLFGLAGSLPVGSAEVTSDQWRLGPEFMLGKINASGAMLALTTYTTSLSDGPANSLLTIQTIVSKAMSGATTLVFAPIHSYNFESEEWVVPLGLGMSKVFMAGTTPISLQVEAYYNIIEPDDFGQEWLLRFTLTPVVPNVLAKWTGAT